MEGVVATIRDVAERAGVSRSTVSRYISHQGYVGPDARTRIATAIEELAFVPNAMARGLKTRRSGLVALLVPEIVNSFYTTISRGVEDVANEHGLHVIVGNTDEDAAKEQTYVDLMIAFQIDGVIVASAGRTARPLQPLLQKKIPTVLIDRVVAGFDADLVQGDNLEGTVVLTRHLLSLGHRQIAFVNGDLDTSVAREREAGFRRALRDAGVLPDEDLMSAGSWFIDDAEQRTARLIASGRPFTAIFAANNFMAIGALRALRASGLRVPEDIALVCFDDLEQAAEIDPFLTVMAQPAYTMGTLAMQLLVERIDRKYAGASRVLTLSPRLLVRRSCGAGLAQDAPGLAQCEGFVPAAEAATEVVAARST
jgi:LacI family transcriptional regulator